MRQRCSKTYRDGYDRYGGRGITVCDEWDRSFIAFKTWADSAGYMDDLSIDRIDPDGNYGPSNCRWATIQEQGDNKRNSCYVEVDGVTKTVAAWAHERGFHLTTLYRRYRQGIRGREFLKPSVKKPKPISLDDIRQQSAQRDKLARLGGAGWVRGRIERAKENTDV